MHEALRRIWRACKRETDNLGAEQLKFGCAVMVGRDVTPSRDDVEYQQVQQHSIDNRKHPGLPADGKQTRTDTANNFAASPKHFQQSHSTVRKRAAKINFDEQGSPCAIYNPTNSCLVAGGV